MTQATDALAIVAKYPEPGTVKTRLGAAIGYRNAADLYRAFLVDLAKQYGDNQHVDNYHLHWACAPSLQPMASVIGKGASLLQQRGRDFAERLFNVCVDMRSKGYRRLVISSSDSPHLPVGVVRQAFELLNRRDVVLGPAEDGGYYLIGLHLHPEAPDLFCGIPMSTATVLNDTVRRAEALGATVGMLTSTFDVDEAEDLPRLKQTLLRADVSLTPRTWEVLDRLEHLGFLAAESRRIHA